MTATASPSRIRVQNIPAELREIPQWIVFAVSPGRSGKLDKRPYIPGSQNLAASNDPATWATFDLALADTERTGRYLGFCFTPELGYVFLDFDSVLGAHGAVKTYAATVIDTLDSYSEVSAGGNGVHVFVRGSLPANFTKDAIGGKVEVYPQAGGRFCLVTGDTRPGLGSLDGIIEERTAELAALFPSRPPASRATSSHNSTHAAALTETEQDVIVAAMRSSWSLGQKHDMGMAIGGIMAKNGVALHQALTMAERLSVDDAKPQDRIKAVRDSYRRAEAGLDVKGYQALRDMMSPEALAVVDGVLSRIWQAQQPTLVTPGRAQKLRAAAKSDVPVANWTSWPDPPEEAITQWFRNYLDLVTPTTEAPPAFHLASALTIAGAAIGKRIRTEYASEPLYANLFTVLIGPSGSSRKDTAIKRSLSLSWPPSWERQLPSPPYQTVTDVSSAEGLIQSMKDHPNTCLYLTELSNLMRNARRKGTSTILPRLIEAFDTPARMSNLSKGDKNEVLDPYLSIIAATQPGILAGEMSSEDIHSGFANRWLFIPGDRKERKPTPDKLDKVTAWRIWRDLNEAIHSYPIGTVLEEAHDVAPFWDTWYLQERSQSEEEGAMSVRHPVLARKIALIHAVTQRAEAIEIDHLRAAIAFVDWMWEQVRRLMIDWGVGVDSQIENCIVDVLSRHGPLSKRELQMKTKRRKWSAPEFDRVFRAMQNNQTIGFDGDGKVGLRDD